MFASLHWFVKLTRIPHLQLTFVARRLLDLLAVLVRPGQEEHLAPFEPRPARHHVGGDARVGVADMGSAVDVVDRRRDVEAFGHDPFSMASEDATAWRLSRLTWSISTNLARFSEVFDLGMLSENDF